MIADGKNTYLMSGLNGDIVECWQSCYELFKDQPKELVKRFKRGDVNSTIEEVYGFMVKSTYYRLDDDGVQMIKSPARLIEDGCGDCKSYTMFIASCLHCLEIPCIVRFVNFDGGDQYTHVYPVAIDEYGNEIPMDACEIDNDGKTCLLDYARPYTKKKDLVYGR